MSTSLKISSSIFWIFPQSQKFCSQTHDGNCPHLYMKTRYMVIFRLVIFSLIDDVDDDDDDDDHGDHNHDHGNDNDAYDGNCPHLNMKTRYMVIFRLIIFALMIMIMMMISLRVAIFSLSKK